MTHSHFPGTNLDTLIDTETLMGGSVDRSNRMRKETISMAHFLTYLLFAHSHIHTFLMLRNTNIYLSDIYI